MKTCGYKNAATRAQFEKNATPITKGKARLQQIRLKNSFRRKPPPKITAVDNSDSGDT